jgi:hypothetical protein
MRRDSPIIEWSKEVVWAGAGIRGSCCSSQLLAVQVLLTFNEKL